MKRLIMILALGTVVLSAGTLTVIKSGKLESKDMPQQAMTMKVDTPKVEYKEVRIKDGGVERIIYVEVLKEEDKLNSRVGLITKFNKNIDIDEFAARFGLKFKAKLESINYYIFENKSEFTDIELISHILETEVKIDISTIRANWPMDVVPN